VGDAIFQAQADWSQNGKVEDAVARALTADEMKKVRVMAKDPAIHAQVEADIALGKQNNVNQTPTLIISGKGQKTPVPGVVTYAILKRYLETLL
jgi:protein-disulfide isomerase